MNAESQINIQELIEFIDDQTSETSANGFIQDSQMFYEVSKRLSNLQELMLTNEEIKEVIKSLEDSIYFDEKLGFFELKDFALAILRKAQENG